MSEAEKLKKEWFTVLKAIGNILELEDSSDKSEMFSLMLEKKRKMEKEIKKYFEIVQITTFSLKPLNQNQ